MVYADSINLFGGNINTIKKKTEALTDAGKETGLELNTFFSLEDEGDMFL
jgi:hypothetical protein